MKKWELLSVFEGAAVRMDGTVGEMNERVLKRLHDSEFNYPFLIADLDFNQVRWFTNYSGDISGRFLEVMALASGGDTRYHEALEGMLSAAPGLQTEAGHFGVELDWESRIDQEDDESGSPRMMPILWGASRILPGLVKAYQVFGGKELLDSARKLGDFFVNTRERFLDPERLEEYRASGTYAAGYVTCYFACMEGLVLLAQETGDSKYLEQARRMADFRRKYRFDHLPIEHTHGYLCSVYGLLLIHQTSGEVRSGYLDQAVKTWDILVDEGFIDPSGGLLEKGIPGFMRDEGCSAADWLRVNLLLWELTGAVRYLDMAERVLYNHLRVNQCDTGGFGHRMILRDEYGVSGYGKYDEEALWCCTFHGAMALQQLKRYLYLQQGDAVLIPFSIPFKSEGGRRSVFQKEVPAGADELLRRKLRIDSKTGGLSRVGIRIPVWAKAVEVLDRNGAPAAGKAEDGILWIETDKSDRIEFTICYQGGNYAENRRFRKWSVQAKQADYRGIVVLRGPELLGQAGELKIEVPIQGIERIHECCRPMEVSDEQEYTYIIHPVKG